MHTVDRWDQECQWRIEDLEAKSSGMGAKERDGVNGDVPPDKLAVALARVRIGACFAGVADTPTRLRVRFVLDKDSTLARHIMTDYAVMLPEKVAGCVREKLHAQAFPKIEQFDHAIIVHGFDTAR